MAAIVSVSPPSDTAFRTTSSYRLPVPPFFKSMFFCVIIDRPDHVLKLCFGLLISVNYPRKSFSSYSVSFYDLIPHGCGADPNLPVSVQCSVYHHRLICFGVMCYK